MIASRFASRTAMVVHHQQKRGLIDWMVKWPDRVLEYKKIQLKGGVLQGASNPTWYKQQGDTAVLVFGAALVGYGMFQTCVGYYHLATGKGKIQ